MKKINSSLLILALSCAACGGAPRIGGSTASQIPKQSSTPVAQSDGTWYEVKVVRAGSELASYKYVGVREVGVISNGKAVTMFLNSPDNKNILTVDVRASAAGVYPLADRFGADKPGEARLNFMTDGAPVLAPIIGEVRLDEFSDTSCSGSLSGSGTDIKGTSFSIEGTFSKLRVKRSKNDM
jgi:hypothetical protein